jgi:hypothetical protein
MTICIQLAGGPRARADWSCSRKIDKALMGGYRPHVEESAKAREIYRLGLIDVG